MGEVTGIVGETVWARMGSYGWREAVVSFPGLTRKWVSLIFANKTRGKRLIGDLKPRDPLLNETDKPGPEEAKKILKK